MWYIFVGFTRSLILSDIVITRVPDQISLAQDRNKPETCSLRMADQRLSLRTGRLKRHKGWLSEYERYGESTDILQNRESL